MKKFVLIAVVFSSVALSVFLYLDQKSPDKTKILNKTTSEGNSIRQIYDAKPEQYSLAGNDNSVFKGPAFSSPDEISTAQTAEWREKPVVYPADFADADLVVSLDQQLYGLFHEEIENFADSNNKKIVVTEGTCGISARELEQKSVDMGGFCCPPAIRDRLPGLEYHTLGISSLALLVHPDNPLTNISTDEARKVFNGEIHRWSQLAGDESNERGIVVATRLHCKIRPGHWRLILDKPDDFATTAREMGDIPYMLTQVSRQPAMLGYETLFMVEKSGKPVKILQVDHIKASDLNALSRGYYPFYRVYNVTTWKSPQSRKLANRLLRFLESRVATHPEKYQMVPLVTLKANGWKVKGSELTGEPDSPGLPE